MSSEIIELIGKAVNLLNTAKKINKTVNIMKAISIFGLISVIGLNIFSVIRNS